MGRDVPQHRPAFLSIRSCGPGDPDRCARHRAGASVAGNLPVRLGTLGGIGTCGDGFALFVGCGGRCASGSDRRRNCFADQIGGLDGTKILVGFDSTGAFSSNYYLYSSRSPESPDFELREQDFHSLEYAPLIKTVVWPPSKWLLDSARPPPASGPSHKPSPDSKPYNPQSVGPSRAAPAGILRSHDRRLC